MRSAAWYAIPSANVDLCRETLPAWREMGYRVAVLQNRERGEIPADITVWSDTYPGWAASVNLLCRQIVPREAPIVITGGDDMLPDPTRPAHEIRDEFLARFPGTFGVMQPIGDTFMNSAEYCGSPWLGRGWIDHAYRGHGPMWPGYRHNWADHELWCVAGAYNALWQRPDLAHEHRHFSRTSAPPPSYWNEQVAPFDQHDVEQFVGRWLTGFPMHEPIGLPPVNPASWRTRYTGPAPRYWATRYAGSVLRGDASSRLEQALNECASLGAQTVVIYGAGTELRAAGDALREPPARILSLADDRPEHHGKTLWGMTIRSINDPVCKDADAVVICTRQFNHPMGERARLALGERAIIVQTGESVEEAAHA